MSSAPPPPPKKKWGNAKIIPKFYLDVSTFCIFIKNITKKYMYGPRKMKILHERKNVVFNAILTFSSNKMGMYWPGGKSWGSRYGKKEIPLSQFEHLIVVKLASSGPEMKFDALDLGSKNIRSKVSPTFSSYKMVKVWHGGKA